MFKKYQHVEKFGNDEVLGIELGKAYIFPKLDGTNASLWQANEFNDYPYSEGVPFICGGSRNRQLTIDNDNAGFYKECLFDSRYEYWFNKYSHLRLYGEWLVPHTIKTYREDAWHKFYIFDVYNDKTDSYLTYEEYKPLLEEFDLDYIPPLAIIKNGTYESFVHQLSNNILFIKDGEGVGEGIVIKNYDFYNKFGKQVWAKIITSEFKEKHYKEMGCPESEKTMLEERISNDYVTTALVDKTYAKIHNEMDGWTSKYIPRLLETIYHDLITEELWSILKEYKNPTINFTTLKHFVVGRIKQIKQEVF